MANYTPTEYAYFISKVDMRLISSLKPKDFVDFGVMDSKKYCLKLFRLLDDVHLNVEERTMVIVLLTKVPSKKRLLAAMDKFKNEQWYTNVRSFVQNKIVPKVSDETNDTLAPPHVPSSTPFLASRIWLQTTEREYISVKEFLGHLWAAQIYLNGELMSEQRTWETNFWNDTVKDSKEPGFHDNYWKTKSTDEYRLIQATGEIFFFDNPVTMKREGEEGIPYSREGVEAWFLTKLNSEEAKAFFKKKPGPHRKKFVPPENPFLTEAEKERLRKKKEEEKKESSSESSESESDEESKADSKESEKPLPQEVTEEMLRQADLLVPKGFKKWKSKARAKYYKEGLTAARKRATEESIADEEARKARAETEEETRRDQDAGMV